MREGGKAPHERAPLRDGESTLPAEPPGTTAAGADPPATAGPPGTTASFLRATPRTQRTTPSSPGVAPPLTARHAAPNVPHVPTPLPLMVSTTSPGRNLSASPARGRDGGKSNVALSASTTVSTTKVARLLRRFVAGSAIAAVGLVAAGIAGGLGPGAAAGGPGRAAPCILAHWLYRAYRAMVQAGARHEG